ncbi:hypothetical protein ACPUVO_14315 [Pseudocolwellia sp. HL-MZ19]|uniref:hypothetical protein n=1 Tax=Pseudocolwellia sp. HL-MZ19 TaxID=3400846 RepID=UPI003CEE6B08
MKLTFKILGLFFLTSIVLISIIGLLALQSQPQFQNQNTVNVQAATESKAAAKRFVDSLRSKKQPVILSLSQAELNGLNALVNRAFPKIVSDVIIQNETAKLNVSVELPLPKFIKYLNVSGDLYPSNKGLELGDVSIGGLTLSGNTLLALTRWTVDSFIQDDLGTKIVSMVQWVTLKQEHLRVSLLVPDDMNQLDQGKSGLFALRDNLALFGDVNKVKFYHQALVQHLDATQDKTKLNKELPYYLQTMFALAKLKTLSNQDEGKPSNAVQENYSALMAVALYFGSNSFELLLGDVSNLNVAQRKTRTLLRRKVTLRNRVDLQKHFMYSVALQLFGNSKASDAIGELKEFLDSNPGGSGFSFADLMADRAGTRFAKLATTSESSALKLQNTITNSLTENDFMPLIQGIPEGISANLFNEDYRDVDSLEYKNMISFLDGKLAELSLYK